MAYTGSAPNQTYQRTDGVRTGSAVNVTARNAGVNDTAELADARENDLAAAINLLFLRNGGNTATDDLPMGGNVLTGLGLGTNRTDSTRIDQVQDGDLVYAAVGGTADAIELTLTPAVTAVVEGMMIIFIPSGDNTTAVTIDTNGVGAVALEYNGVALSGGELQGGQPVIIVHDGTNWQLVTNAGFLTSSDIGSTLQAHGDVLDDLNTLGAAASDGQFIVATGAGAFAYESGATARTSLGLSIGTDVQAHGDVLDDLNALGAAASDGEFIVATGAGAFAYESGATARASLGLAIGTDVQAYDADTAKLDVEQTWGAAQTLPNTGLHILDTGGDHDYIITPGEDATADRTLTLDLGDADRTLTLNDDITPLGQGLHTITIPATAMLRAITNGPSSAQVESASNDINYKVLDFDASTDEYAHFNILMPKGWNEGTVSFQVTWTTTATDTDGVAWGLQAVAISDNESIDASWGTAVVVTDNAQSAAGEALVTSISSAVTVGGSPAEGDIVFFRIFRDVSDGNDDMTEDARLISIKILYTVNAATDA
jgi:hypothetical protein